MKRAPPLPMVRRGTSSILIVGTAGEGIGAAHTGDARARRRMQSHVWLKDMSGDGVDDGQEWNEYTATLQRDSQTVTFVGGDADTMTRTATVSKATSILDVSPGDGSGNEREHAIALTGCSRAASCFHVAFPDGDALAVWRKELESIVSEDANLAITHSGAWGDATDGSKATHVAAASPATTATPANNADDSTAGLTEHEAELLQMQAAREAEEDEFEALWEKQMSPPPPELPPKSTPTATRDEAHEESESPPPLPLPDKIFGDLPDGFLSASGSPTAQLLPPPPPEESVEAPEPEPEPDSASASASASACVFALLDTSENDVTSSSFDEDGDHDDQDVNIEIISLNLDDGKEDGEDEEGGEVQAEATWKESLYAQSTKTIGRNVAGTAVTRTTREKLDRPLAEMSDLDVRNECRQLRLALQLSRGKASRLEAKVNELTLQVAAQATMMASSQSRIVNRVSFTAKPGAPPLPAREDKPKKKTTARRV